MKDYRVGISKHWPGSCVFWQTDINGSIAPERWMLTIAETGKRREGAIQPCNMVIRCSDRLTSICAVFLREHLFADEQRQAVAIVDGAKRLGTCGELSAGICIGWANRLWKKKTMLHS